MLMRGRQVAGVLIGAVLAAACTSDSDNGETGSAAPSIVDAASSAEDQVDAAPADSSWNWIGLLIQADGVTRACFGEVESSEPPGCPNGMPIVDFDLRDTSWAEYYEQDDRTVAFANITGRPTTDGFVLHAPIFEADGALEPLSCEQFETGVAAGDTPNPQPAFDLLLSPSAQEAGVWFSSGGTRGVDGIDATVLVLDESVRDWFRSQTVFDGFTLNVCPQLRPA